MICKKKDEILGTLNRFPRTFSFEAFGISDIGLIREKNEDAFLSIPDAGVFIIADGMGGHNAGEVASDMAVKTLSEILVNKPIDSTTLRRAFLEVNRLVFEKSATVNTLYGMGTTLLCLTFSNEMALYMHVGDSRLYLLREKNLELLTRDHTLINERGFLKDKSLKHILTKAIGTQDFVEPTFNSSKVFHGDLFLLCTDGLTNFVPEKQMEETLNQNISLEQKGKQLIELAKIHGGGDNITLILVKIINDLSRQ